MSLGDLGRMMSVIDHTFQQKDLMEMSINNSDELLFLIISTFHYLIMLVRKKGDDSRRKHLNGPSELKIVIIYY